MDNSEELVGPAFLKMYPKPHPPSVSPPSEIAPEEELECLSSTPSSETDSEEEDDFFSSTATNSEELVGQKLSVSLKTSPKSHPPSVSPPIHLPVDHQDGM